MGARLLIDPALQVSDLPSVKFRELHPQFRNKVKNAHKNLKLACIKMVALYSYLTGRPPQQILPEHILTKDIERGIYVLEINMKWNISHGARGICRLFGNTELFHIDGRYECYHPKVLAWVQTLPKRRRPSSIQGCMYFLKWVSSNVLTKTSPHEVSIFILSRSVLIKYRRWLLTRVNTGKVSYLTASGYMHYVTRWTRWLISSNHLPSFDTQRLAIKQKQERERLLPTHAQLGLFFKALLPERKSFPYFVYFTLMAATGARPVELHKLTINDVDFRRRRVWLQSKRGLGRFVPLQSSVLALLKVYSERFHETTFDPNDLFFKQENGRRFAYKTTVDFFNSVLKESGVLIDGQMALRHLFATDCLEQNIPLNVTRYLLDHRDVSQLMRYQHVQQKNLHASVNKAFGTDVWKEHLLGG